MPELIKFSTNIEEVCVKTVESGSMTKDLAILIDKSTKYLTTNQFLEALDKNLQKKSICKDRIDTAHEDPSRRGSLYGSCLGFLLNSHVL